MQQLYQRQKIKLSFISNMVVGCIGCCVYPHGRRSIYALLLGISSYIFLSVSMWSCVYVRIDGYLALESPYRQGVSSELFTSQVGLFSFQEFAEFGNAGTTGGNYACVAYSSGQKIDFFDGAIKAARGFAVLANITIGAGVLALLIASCAYFEIILLHWCGWLFVVGSVFEMLTLVFLASDVLGNDPFHATIWWGAGLAIMSSLIALVTGLITLHLPESEYEPDEDDDSPIQATTNGSNKGALPDEETPMEQSRPMRPGTEITKETILPDGRRKHITTKWNKDGTTTVTETFA